MTELLRAVAGLPQSHDGLAVSLLGDPGRGGFCLTCPDTRSATVVATAANAARFSEVAGDEAEGYARLLSGAPAIRDGCDHTQSYRQRRWSPRCRALVPGHFHNARFRAGDGRHDAVANAGPGAAEPT